MSELSKGLLADQVAEEEMRKIQRTSTFELGEDDMVHFIEEQFRATEEDEQEETTIRGAQQEFEQKILENLGVRLDYEKSVIPAELSKLY